MFQFMFNYAWYLFILGLGLSGGEGKETGIGIYSRKERPSQRTEGTNHAYPRRAGTTNKTGHGVEYASSAIMSWQIGFSARSSVDDALDILLFALPQLSKNKEG